MAEFVKLRQAVTNFSKILVEFPIGAVSLDDCKPTEEKIRDTRQKLRNVNAKLIMLNARYDAQFNKESSKQDMKETFEMLHDATADYLINSKAIKLCLHSDAIQKILYAHQGSPEIQKKIHAYMCKLFTYNDNILSLHQSIQDAFHVQLKLKIQCQKALFEHRDFLKEQKELRNEKLQKTNPEIVENKEKMNKTIQKINIMKKLITNFIALSGRMLQEKPLLVEMLENHRELISIETIFKMSRTNN